MATQQRANVAATSPLAYHAVTQHMIDHNLPAPASIAVATDRNSITLHLIWDTDVTLWLDTLHVDNYMAEFINGNLHTRYAARLPDTGVRVTITHVKLNTNTDLSVVPA